MHLEISEAEFSRVKSSDTVEFILQSSTAVKH